MVSLKNILKDYSIKASYNTTILIFAFVREPIMILTLSIDNGSLLLIDIAAVEHEFTKGKQRSILEYA